nr:hypothetical protein [Shinella sp. HZN7]
MPLADAMTYWLAAPIYVAAMSPLLLGEKGGWRRWTAIIVGFVGVVIALEPSKDTFTLPASSRLPAASPSASPWCSAHAARGAGHDAGLLAGGGAAIFAGVWCLADPAGWAPVSGVDFGLLSLLGIVRWARICWSTAR